MSQFVVLFRKEMLDLWRSYKWLWVPLVFLALGMMQPAATYYLPQIIDSFGGLPEGTVIEIPTPSSGDVLAEALSQLGVIGVLVLVLAAMGVLIAERNSGAAAMLLVKPVSFGAYISSKWAAANLLMLVSVFIGQIGAWYYTIVLFESFPLSTVLLSSLVFALWLSFVLSVLIFISVFLRSTPPVAFVTLIVALVLGMLTQLFGSAMAWSPSRLQSYAMALLTGEAESALVPLMTTIALIVALVAATIFLFRRRQLAA